MSDRYRVTLERRAAGDWTAELVELDEAFRATSPIGLGTGAADSPGGALERVGQHLDELEARRLDREHGLERELALQAAEAAADDLDRDLAEQDREVAGDVARVLEVLEDAGGAPVPTSTIAALAGFATPGPMGDDGRLRALRALRQAQADDVVVLIRAARDGDLVWALERPPSAR